MRLECEGDWDGVIATFGHPRYEFYGAGTVFDGEQAMRGYLTASRYWRAPASSTQALHFA
jgi:hypothetical protein